jgi:hypothetical protein
MYINKKAISIAYKLILLTIGIIGLLLSFGVFDGRFNLSMLNYFTILSNLLCVAYFAGAVITSLKAAMTPGKASGFRFLRAASP